MEPRHVLSAANLLITEFMAANSAALADGDGNFSDWIEIHNAGATAVQLADYALTDMADNLRRWEFPSRLIQPGEYQVVFASSPRDGAGGTLSNYVDAGGNLHTNFSLDAEGEYLALTYEDPISSAITIVHEYGPVFPPQQTDISYGIGQIASELTFVSPGTAAHTVVPSSSSYDAVWNMPGYRPDGNWIAGTTGVGFGETFNGFLVRTYRANTSAGSPIGTTLDNIEEALEVIGNPLAQSSVAAGNFNVVNFINNSTTGGNYDSGNIFFPGLTNADADHFATEAHAVVTIPAPGTWTFGVASNEGFLLQVDEFEIERFGTGNSDQFMTVAFATAGNYAIHLYNFERTGSTWLELFAAPGAFSSWNNANFRLVGDVANGGLAVVSDVVGSSGASINQLLGTDLKSSMLGVNSTFYTRIPFNVADPSALDQLTLRMKYDDAFVSYINSTEVARRNITGATAWNSAADTARIGDDVVVYEDINITPFISTLATGPNVLAIHGLNFSASDPDVLVLPELVGLDVLSTNPAYFTEFTPGDANGNGYAGFVADTRFSVDRGFYDASFQVSVTSATPGSGIYYTTNGDEPTIATGTLYTGPILIDKTTVLRAKAFLAGYLPTNVDTQTYLFLDDVVQQTASRTLQLGFPATWGTSVPNNNFPASVFPDGAGYGLDPDIVGNFDVNGNPIGGDLYGGIYATQLKDALLSIPTMSIVADIDDLFGSNGIVTNASQRGVAWERPTSVEWITTDGTPQFQVDAGIRIQGAFFRSNNNNLKKSFRLLFKNIYGPGKLDFPLFDGSIESYNTLVLRGGGNDGYTWNSAKLTEQYTRDQFMRELQLASGHPAPHGNFAHLYINGVYWGLYNPVERPDNEFAASYLGGDPESWDVVHRGGGTFEAQNGDFAAWNAMMALAQQAGTSHAAYMQLQGKNLDGTANPATPPLLDVVSYIDYIIVNAWGGNWDWPRNNFWAARDSNPLTTTGFHFFNWDGENVMGNNRSRSPVNADVFDPSKTPGNDWGQDGVNDNAGRPHILLRDNAEYRMLFADRVHRMFFNDGLLMADNLIARYQAIADFVELAMIGESARWGDMQAHRSPSPNRALTPADWIAERDWILGTYLPQRSGIVLDQLKFYGFYPNVAAPSFNQHGGFVPQGFDLAISAPAGAIWYTLDGSDPRATGGGMSSTALPYSGTPVDISAALTVRARALVGSEWSAVNEATFITAAPADAANFRLTEVHYHPALHAGIADPDDLEFLEFYNPSGQMVSLAGVEIAEFASPHVYAFDSTLVLAPGERIVVARDPAAFQFVYGTGINLAPTGFKFDGKNLSNAGERIVGRGPLGELFDFAYDDEPPWPTSPDGGGPSLEIIDPLGDPGNPANWRASYYAGGSPGSDGLPLPGDYDANRVVDHHDFAFWRANFGRTVAPNSGADGNGDGVVDAADYAVWRKNLGASLGMNVPMHYTPSFDSLDELEAQSSAAVQDVALAALYASTKPSAADLDSAWVKVASRTNVISSAAAGASLQLLESASKRVAMMDYEAEAQSFRVIDSEEDTTTKADDAFDLVGAQVLAELD